MPEKNSRNVRPRDQAAPRKTCLFSVTLKPHLHDGTELGLILHLILCHTPLHTGQDCGLEEVPPVVMKCPEEELKQLSLHIRGRALRRHTQLTLTFFFVCVCVV
jgi:hypothetical protein